MTPTSVRTGKVDSQSPSYLHCVTECRSWPRPILPKRIGHINNSSGNFSSSKTYYYLLSLHMSLPGVSLPLSVLFLYFIYWHLHWCLPYHHFVPLTPSQNWSKFNKSHCKKPSVIAKQRMKKRAFLISYFWVPSYTLFFQHRLPQRGALFPLWSFIFLTDAMLLSPVIHLWISPLWPIHGTAQFYWFCQGLGLGSSSFPCNLLLICYLDKIEDCCH